MVYSSFMDMGVSQGKPFSLLWAEAQMGLMLSLIPCRCGAVILLSWTSHGVRSEDKSKLW